MNCVGAIDLMDVEIEGVLPDDVRPDFDEHIAWCGPCRRYLAQLHATIDTLGRLPRPVIPDPHRDALLERFRARNRPRR